MILNSIVCRLTLAMLSTILASELFAMEHYDEICSKSKKTSARDKEIANAKKPRKNTVLNNITRKAAEGDLYSKNILGFLYETGDGVQQSYTDAYKYYKDASKNGNRLSMFNIGRLYDNGWGVEQNTDKAIKYYKKAMLGDYNHHKSMRKTAKASIPEVKYAMGRIYENGYGVSPDNRRAKHFYKLAAQDYYPVALTSLAIMYECGKGTKENIKKAISYYHTAASLSEPNAQCNLGGIYENGIDGVITPNILYAKRLYTAAAAQNHAAAQFYLANMHRTGILGNINYDEAFNLYKRAAAQGNAMANHNLGYMYENGHGTEINYTEAMRCYKKAAELGNVLSYIAVGSMYHKGLSVRTNTNLAAKNYEKAMSLDSEKTIESLKDGDADDQFILGYIYQNGLGITVNQAEASRLYQLAADKGHEDAIHVLDEINRRQLNESLTVSDKLIDLDFCIPDNEPWAVQGNLNDMPMYTPTRRTTNWANTTNPSTNEIEDIINVDDDSNSDTEEVY